MKRYFLLFAVGIVALFASCEGGFLTSQESITDYDESKLNQIVYADEISTGGDFTFTAAEAWNTVVESTTKVGEVDWLTLDPASGEAGEVNMSIKLSANTTGKDRSANIKIVCGKSSITLTVEQKATIGSGEKPKARVVSSADIKYERYDEWNDSWEADECSFAFEYDEQGRMISFTELEWGVCAVIYSDDAIKIKGEDEDANLTYTLDDKNRVESIYIDAEERSIDIAYDGDYIVKAFTPLNITWKDGNIVETYWSYGGSSLNAEGLSYEYTNHEIKNINLDLNSFFLGGAWESLAFFMDEICDVHPIQSQGYFGKGCKNYISRITRDYPKNESDSSNITCEMKMDYKFNNDGTPSQIIRTVMRDKDGDGKHIYVDNKSTITVNYK